MSTEKLSIESPVFAKLRMLLDSKLNSIVNKMLSKGVDDGKLTLQLEVHTVHGAAQDPDVQGEMTKETIIPMFRYKLTDAITLKTDHSGTIGDTEHELIKDRDSDGWLIGNVSDGQMMFSEYCDDPDE